MSERPVEPSAAPVQLLDSPPLSRPVEASVVVAGLFVGGLVGGVMAVVALIILRSEGDVGVAQAAALLLGAAAVGTIVVGTGAGIDPRYAQDREVAALAGLWAGVCLIVAVVSMSLHERSLRPWRAIPAPSSSSTSHVTVRQFAVLTASAVAVVGVRVLGTPAPLRPDIATLVTNLRAGRGYTFSTSGPLAPTALHPPLAPVVAAVWPGSLDAVLVVVSSLTVLAVWRLARRVTTAWGAVAAAALAAGLPSFWGQQLPEALAALGVAAGLALAWPHSLTRRRSLAAGGCLAGAVLARPETMLVIPVVVVWIALVRRREGRQYLAAFVLVAAVVLAPWELHMQSTFHTWLPSTSLGATLEGANRPPARSGERIGELVPLPRPLPGEDEGALDARRRSSGWDAFAKRARPQLIGARVLRAWDLWPPDGARSARQARGLDLPGGAPGVVAEGATVLAAVFCLVLRRRRWRDLLPLYALPLAFTGMVAVTYGSRDLRSWLAPVLAVCAGALIGWLLPGRRHAWRGA